MGDEVNCCQSPSLVAEPERGQETLRVHCKSCRRSWPHPNGRELFHYFKQGYLAASRDARLAADGEGPKHRWAILRVAETLAMKAVGL